MKTVFLFSGQGSQYYQMGSALFETDSTFRQHMHDMDEIVRSVQGVSVLEELYNKRYRLFDPFYALELTHPAIFMTEYALSKSLEKQGVIPDYLVGCSLGEYAAAAIAGVFSGEDALRLVLQQVSIIRDTCREGRMVAVLDDPATYFSHPVMRDNSTLAALNGPAQFVLSGEKMAMESVKSFMKQHVILHQELMVSYGFHSPAIMPAEAAFRACLEARHFRQPGYPLVSGVTGKQLLELPKDHFWDVVRKPALYLEAVRSLENSGRQKEELMYIDLGPAGSLANLIKSNIPEGSPSKGFQIMSPFRQEVKKISEVIAYSKEHKKGPGMAFPVKRERLQAIVFPGQGSQKRGMGEDVFDLFPKLTDRASEILGYSVKELCLHDPQRRLNMTQYTQPALYVVNALSYMKLKEETGVEPDFLAGHSLGEYNALLASGGMDFETGLRLVEKRGALMARMQEGGMAAVKGLSGEEIRAIIERHNLEGMDMANYNTQNQVVLSGPKELIERSGNHFTDAGATLYFQLNVSGAFHSRYMLPAKTEFDQFLRSCHFSPMKIPVVSNVEAAFYRDDRIGMLLGNQLVKPVRWLETVLFLLEKGEITIKEVGPGDVLTKMVWAIERDRKEVLQ